jgi:LPXTG-motif cell wall-anchored protein
MNNGRVSGVVDSVFTISQEGTTLPLPDGYYRLTERTAPDGYRKMDGTIAFSVSDGVITMINALDSRDYAVELKQEVTEDGSVVHKTIGLELYNYEKVPVSIWKTDFDKRAITTGASFVLYRADNFDDESQQPIEADEIVMSGTTGQNGILSLGELELGEYRLVETKAPAGYIPAEHAIKIFVNINSISAMQETGYSDVYYKGDDCWVSDQNEKTAQIRIWNNPGTKLPSTGGPGTKLFYLFGFLFTGIAGAGLMMRRRRRDAV